ncbi:hypothetical protein [Tropicibacter oceani]|uniref:Uncharacterized protein n=1 Tax=Tropicibacter oceani TaxID=3058420 RepID=A0ABY8QG29_9RHOB|nr:hypothetical protein [Tropicibacter oceani]WGW03581.1 hypothetical protein QF118_16905 [Tropicibacter oceani]
MLNPFLFTEVDKVKFEFVSGNKQKVVFVEADGAAIEPDDTQKTIRFKTPDLPTEFSHVVLEFRSQGQPVLEVTPTTPGLAIWLDQHEFRVALDGDLPALEIGQGREYPPVFHGLNHNRFDPTGKLTTEVRDNVGTDDEITRFDLVISCPHASNAQLNFRFRFRPKDSVHDFELTSNEDKSHWKASLDCVKDAEALWTVLHSAGRHPEINLIAEPPRSTPENLGRRLQPFKFRLDLEPENADRKRVFGFRRDESLYGIGKKYRWYRVVGGSTLTIALHQKLVGDEEIRKAYAAGNTLTVSGLHAVANSNAETPLTLDLDRKATTRNGNALYTGTMKVELAPGPSTVLLELTRSFDAEYDHRIALDLGAGSHLMAYWDKSSKKQRILNISRPANKLYSLDEETSSRLYKTTELPAEMLYAGTAPFIIAGIRKRFPKAAQAVAEMTVLYGADEIRATLAEELFAKATVSDFKTRFFRGETALTLKGETFDLRDIFQEICRKRFIEAVFVAERESSSQLLQGDPAAGSLPTPVQMIVTHPGYVSSDTYVAMEQRLRELLVFLVGTGVENYVQAVCTIPEPTAVLRFLHTEAKVRSGGQEIPVSHLAEVCLLDCGFRTLDVATLGTEGEQRRWRHTSAADLGGSILDVSIGNAIRECIEQVLPNNRDLLDLAFDLDDPSLAKGLDGAMPGQDYRRKRIGLERLEEAKISFTKHGASATVGSFNVVFAQDDQYDNDSNWFPRELIDALENMPDLGKIRLVTIGSQRALEILWSDIADTHSIRTFRNQLSAFLAGLPKPDDTHWIVTGRGARFSPYIGWIDDAAEKHGIKVFYESDILVNGVAGMDPKGMVVRGALSLAEKLGSYNVELLMQACLFLIDSSNGNRIVEVAEIKSVEERQERICVIDTSFDRVCICRCSAEVARYIMNNQDTDPEAPKRFMISEALAVSQTVGPFTSGFPIEIFTRVQDKTLGATTMHVTVKLFFKSTIDATMPTQAQAEFRIARFGAIPTETST